MKLIRADQDKFEFQIPSAEKELLFHILGLYPLVPPTHHRLSKGQIPDHEADQQLLEESLAAQRRQNRKQIDAMLKEPGRFVAGKHGCRVSFTRAEIEWLLQVCNDVRMGSWIALGSPDLQAEHQLRFSKASAPHMIAMDVAGFFEMSLLNAVSGG